MAKRTTQYTTIGEALQAHAKSTARKRRAKAKRAAKIQARLPGEGYEPCIVSFIDVLGFRHLMNTRHALDICDVLKQLREFTAPAVEPPARPVKDARLHSRAFSDSVSDAVVRVRVYDTQFNDGAFYNELLDLLHAQIECIGKGVVIRAGVAVGPAHVGIRGKGPVFGAAMVRAYEIESNEALFPRIVVDHDAYQKFLDDERLRNQNHTLEEEQRYVDGLLRIDEDGKRFINYLAASESEFDDPPSYFDFLGRHAKLIREKLHSTTDRVRAKFEWLAKYHNSVITDLLAEFEFGRRSANYFYAEFGEDIILFLQEAIIEE